MKNSIIIIMIWITRTFATIAIIGFITSEQGKIGDHGFLGKIQVMAEFIIAIYLVLICILLCLTNLAKIAS